MSEDYRPPDPDPVDVLRRIAREIDHLPDLHGYRPNTAWLRKAAAEIEELRLCIRALCPEIEARKLLSFKTAEAIFAQ